MIEYDRPARDIVIRRRETGIRRKIEDEFSGESAIFSKKTNEPAAARFIESDFTPIAAREPLRHSTLY